MEEVLKLTPNRFELTFKRKMMLLNNLKKANLHLKTIFTAKFFKRKRKMMILISLKVKILFKKIKIYIKQVLKVHISLKV